MPQWISLMINEITFSHSIINRFWSTTSQMVDNAELHHIMKKNSWFFMKILKFWAKKSFRSLILIKKNPVWSWQIRHAGYSTINELSKSLIFKSNLNLMIQMGFVPHPLISIFSKSSLIIWFWLIFLCETSLFDKVENEDKFMNFHK